MKAHGCVCSTAFMAGTVLGQLIVTVEPFDIDS